MKKLLLTLTFILAACGVEHKPENEPYKPAEKIEQDTLSSDEVALKYSTYLVVKDRIFRMEGDIRHVKMKTEIHNKTDKDIFCIKGWLVVKDDLTGKEFCKFYIDCPRDIPKRGKIEHTTEEYRCDLGVPMHKKLLEMDPCEFNSWVSWEVEQIKFEDGTKIEKESKRKQSNE